MPSPYESQPLAHHPDESPDPHPEEAWEEAYEACERAQIQLEEDQTYAEILEANEIRYQFCKELGEQLRFDLGLEPTNANVAECQRLATEDDISEAQCRIADCYRDGVGIRQSYEQAAYWYMVAGHTEDSYAMRDLVTIHGLDSPSTLAPGNAGHRSR